MKRILTLLAATLLIASTQVARASDQQEVVDGAAIVVDKIQSGTGAETNIRELLHRARGILIVPELVKGGFILGGQGGNGVLLQGQLPVQDHTSRTEGGCTMRGITRLRWRSHDELVEGPRFTTFKKGLGGYVREAASAEARRREGELTCCP